MPEHVVRNVAILPLSCFPTKYHRATAPLANLLLREAAEPACRYLAMARSYLAVGNPVTLPESITESWLACRFFRHCYGPVHVLGQVMHQPMFPCR
jgi:hypothetical protein